MVFENYLFTYLALGLPLVALFTTLAIGNRLRSPDPVGMCFRKGITSVVRDLCVVACFCAQLSSEAAAEISSRKRLSVHGVWTVEKVTDFEFIIENKIYNFRSACMIEASGPDAGIRIVLLPGAKARVLQIQSKRLSSKNRIGKAELVAGKYRVTLTGALYDENYLQHAATYLEGGIDTVKHLTILGGAELKVVSDAGVTVLRAPLAGYEEAFTQVVKCAKRL